MDLPFAAETDEERGIVGDPEWRVGAAWGEPRSGHPEGAVKHHIAEVLANLDRLSLDPLTRRRLRIAALVHDTWKRAVDRSMDRIPPNEHGYLAARWLERHTGDAPLVTLVELHDEGFRAWRAHQAGQDDEASSRIAAVIRRMGDDIGLFVSFYWADNRTGEKSPEQVPWFIARVRETGIAFTVPDLD